MWVLHKRIRVLLLLLLLFYFFRVFHTNILLEAEWQQVSLSLQDSSRDPGRSQQCCCLDGQSSYSDF